MIWQRKFNAWLFLVFFPVLSQVACSSGEGTTPAADTSPATPPATIRTVSVSWNANRETAVNALGGGYKLYYSTVSGFDISDAGVSVVDVPFVAPPAAPTSISLQLASGRYYFRVVAYSALNSPWDGGGSSSAPSVQLSLLVP